MTDDIFVQVLQEDVRINSPVDVGNRIWAIRKLEEKITALKNTRESYMGFFRDEIDKLERNTEFLKAQIYTHLAATGEKSLKTPAGTAVRTSRAKVTWPDDDVLITFAEVNKLPVKVMKKVDKKDVAAFIKETGATPPGYKTEQTVGLTIKGAATEPKPDKDEWDLDF